MGASNRTPTVNFIGIGGHKCASTWLWYNLNQHPDVWVPHKKELHYFDRSSEYPSPNELATASLLGRLTGRTPDNRTWRKKALRDLAAATIKLDWRRIKWALPFYAGQYDDAWYLKLFSHHHEAVAGEITPAYSMLSVADFEQMKSLLPDIKIVLLLRDPIDRGWSHIRFDAGSGRIHDINDWDEVKAYIDGPTLTMRGDYVSLLDRLDAVFDPSQLFIGYYDLIRSDPVSFLASFGKFLGIDPGRFPSQNVHKKVGISQSRQMPDHIEKYLAQKYLPELQLLENRLGNAVVPWREHAENVLHSKTL